uniref:Uncharacterized protein n=1 Tax=Klebsiella pneumoniae TaxID=573 RepID=A0A8B0SX00_KLEPN|nr:hypothetical protein [Klebsiella pneumoniae]
MNEIYATDLASVMNVMDSMTANSLKTASVPMVTSTGLQYASCTDARAAVKSFVRLATGRIYHETYRADESVY